MLRNNTPQGVRSLLCEIIASRSWLQYVSNSILDMPTSSVDSSAMSFCIIAWLNGTKVSYVKKTVIIRDGNWKKIRLQSNTDVTFY